MSDKERIPVSFWLKDKTVTGLLVADHGGKKLVSYSGKYFIVTDKTPEKRHYTESTLPASWKKMITGEAPPSPTAPKAGKAGGKTIAVAVDQSAALGAPPKPDIPAHRAVRGTTKLRGKASAESLQAPKASPESTNAPKASPESAKAPKTSPESAKAPKPSPKGAKERGSAAKGHTAEKDAVGYFCPYCSTEHSCSADKAGAPFFQQCSKCGKDFGVKITARLVYQAEVAAFR